MINFNKNYPPGIAVFIIYLHEGKVLFIADNKDLRRRGEAVFQKFLLKDKEFKISWKRWQEMLNKFKKFILTIKAVSLQKMSERELAISFIRWNRLYSNEFWNVGTLPEVANWGGEQILIRELSNKIKNQADFNYCLERLSAPEDLSFYQREEVDLLKIKKIKNIIKRVQALRKHQAKYFWILNSYHHTVILPMAYFRKRLVFFTTAGAAKKIKQINKIASQSIRRKKEVIKTFNLPISFLKISRRLAFSIWWQDWRKSYILQANYIIDLYLKEIAKRKKIDFDDIHYYTHDEVDELIERGKILPSKLIKLRKNHFFGVLDADRSKRTMIFGPQAAKMIAPYITKKVDKNLEQIGGLVVNRGKVKGKVRILLSPSEAKKMGQGEILVAPMTSPEYIVALRKAVAVITDEGGLTCHAAIVSRELKIPCVVGTKIATKILRDGDLVEVDADKGVVKILK